MKRIFSLLLCLCMLLSLLPIMSFTVGADNSNGSCGTGLTWSFNSETGELIIRGSGAMDNYTSESHVPWYAYLGSIKSILIGSGVTAIGSSAFSGCSALTGISFLCNVFFFFYRKVCLVIYTARIIRPVGFCHWISAYVSALEKKRVIGAWR